MTISVLIVDDHAMVRAGLAELLRSDPEIVVAGEAANGREAVALASELHPDVVLMDLAMPVLDGIAATREITAARPGTVVIALTTYHDADRIREVLDAGARGYLLKDVEPRALLSAIQTARSGGVPLSPVAARELLTPTVTPSRTPQDLSRREEQILRQVAAGLTNRQIATALGITEKTVKVHLGSVFRRLGVHGRVEAAQWARRHLSEGGRPAPDDAPIGQ
jgi:DNA-binding NarL/FixJ family response regulator